MTAPKDPLETIAIAEATAPRLAEASPPRDERLEDLLQGQQEVMSLVLAGAPLDDVLKRLVDVTETVFAPARAVVSLFPRGEMAMKRQAANVPDDLVKTVGLTIGDDCFDPTAAAVLSGERTIIADFASDGRWSDHAALALSHGLHACWAEPVPDCGHDLCGVTTIYYPEPREPDADDERILWTLSSFIAFVVTAAQREAAFRAANERFAALVSSIPGVVYQRVVKPDGDIRYTYISDGARDLFGVSPEQVLADPDTIFGQHSPDYRARFRERLLAASKELRVWDVEATLLRPDGIKKYTHAIAKPTRQEDGSVLWTGVILDETRTREAIIDSLSQGLVLYDAQDRMIMRNNHYLTLYPALRDIAVPGATYEEVTTAELVNARFNRRADLDSRLQERLAGHARPHHVFERQIDENQWILVNEQRTAEGGTVVLYTDVSILKHREKQIEHLAYHDPLTGLPNRALFKQRIERALADAAQSGATVAVLCLDLDRFKHVNDSLGHMAGDELLKTAGERFRDCLREEDTVARLGGDEFGIVLVSHNAFEHATHVATRILASLGRPMSFSGHEIVSGTSIGIATSATDGTEPERLIKAADMALYRAKADGRATYRFFEAEMDARAQARSMLEMDLRQAVARNQFELHYQPQVEMERHSIIGFEALVRWRHPERGLVLPDEFIPLAEETGVINRLGEWVLRQACSDAKDWPSSIKLAVNVSPAQFRNRDLPQVVARVLKRTGFPPERLELEITESLLLEDVAANLALLQELKNLGVRIAMDDFGTGYSSLGNLRSFPFDKIKIDRSFMASLDRNPDSEAIVQAVLGLGQSLRIQTCAEGVETEGQVNYLVTHGCDEAQGYYYSRPRPIAEIGELLEKGFTAPAAQITFVD